MDDIALERAKQALSLQRVQTKTGRLKDAHELRQDEYSPCAHVNAKREMYRAQATMNSRCSKNYLDGESMRAYREAERVASTVGNMCRLCNNGLQRCFNSACQIPTQADAEQKGYDNKAKAQHNLERAAASQPLGKPLERVRMSSELSDGESSPCYAANAQRDLQRAVQAYTPTSGIAGRVQYDDANTHARQTASGCRRCNPLLDRCTNQCDIPTAALARMKGYDA